MRRVRSYCLIASTLLVLVAPAKSFGVEVRLPQKGKFEIWFEDAKGRPLGTKLEVSGQEKVDAQVPAGTPKNVVLRDVKRNNLAVFAFTDEPIAVKAEDFKYAAEVKVSVEHRGKAVASAVVRLKDADGERQELLSPDMNGVVVFPRVRLGEVSAVVEYRVKGEERRSGRLSVELTGDRLERVPLIAFSIPEEVVVVGQPGLLGEGEEPRARPGGRGGLSAGAVIAMVLALAGGIGALYVIVRLVQTKESKVKALMQKLGVQPVGESTDTPTPHTSGFRPEPPPKPSLVPEGACPFCGQTKAADGSCGCTIGATPPAAPTGRPRLTVIAGPGAGKSFELAEGPMVVGRDPGCDFSLSEDSGISRRHAQITFEAGRLRIQDLGSTNGTYVNGVRLDAPRDVQRGDVIQMGESRLRYEV